MPTSPSSGSSRASLSSRSSSIPKSVGEPVLVRAKQTLEELKASGESDVPADVGDPTLLPVTTSLATLSSIARNFGEAFARALTDLPEDEWSGPIESPFGLASRASHRAHRWVRPKARRGSRNGGAKMAGTEARDFQKQAYEQLRAKYDVVLPSSGSLKEGSAR